MKKILTILFALSTCMLLQAETIEERATRKSELRLLVGDMFWETLIWHDTPHINPSGWQAAYTEKTNYSWTPHIGLEYQYRCNRWFSVGLQVDYQQTFWKNNLYDHSGYLTSTTPQTFYNVSILPTVRFTYFHHPNVNLYSSIGLGIDINGGTETDINGKHTACGAALDIAVLGLSVGKDRWFGSVEVGGLSALKNKGTIFMMASRIVTIGVGCRF